MQYTYRTIIVSARLLCNHRLEFNETLWEPAISRGDAHIISYAVICRTIIISALLLYNYWLEFNETLWEPSIPRGDAHIVALFRSDTLTQCYGPWLVMQYTYRTIIVSARLLCNHRLEFNETLWEPSISRGDAHIISYAVICRTIIISALLLCNYWLEFNKTLCEPLILRTDAHILGLFWSDTLNQSYGP
jgi:hypothetical protein